LLHLQQTNRTESAFEMFRLVVLIYMRMK